MGGSARRVVWLLALLTVPGCAARVHNVPASYSAGSGEDSVVVGQLSVDLSLPGAPYRTFVSDLLDPYPSLVVSNETTHQDYEIICDEGGSNPRFWIALPPGSYSLNKVMIHGAAGTLDGRFTVPSRGIVYVGTLRFEMDRGAGQIASSMLSGGYSGHWVVIDDEEEALTGLLRNFGSSSAAVTKSLITLGRRARAVAAASAARRPAARQTECRELVGAARAHADDKS